MATPSEIHDKYRIRLLWAGFAFLYLSVALLISKIPLVGDENTHYAQINGFDHGVFVIAERYLTVLPGYHLIVAAILWATDLRSLAAARLLNALFGVFAIVAFRMLRKQIWHAENTSSTLQFALLPFLFPYNFLVYTDVLSLGLVLSAGAATLRQRHKLAGLLLIVALAVRQINVVWLPFFAALAIWPKGISQLPSPRQVASRAWPYFIGVALFIAFWIWNGHISLSNEQAVMHPDLTVHLGNIYFTLFLCTLFFPLHVAAGLKTFAASVAARPWLILIPLTLFALYWAFFRVDHPYNLIVRPAMLHNLVIQRTLMGLSLKAGFGLLAVASACGLARTRLRPDGAVLLYPVTALALSGSWLIEQRYALIPIALWLAFRERSDHKTETVTTLLWAVITIYFCLGIYRGTFSL